MNSKLCGIIVTLFALSHLNLNAQIILADKTDGSVVAFAQVTDEKGNTIGMSDMDGRVLKEEEKDVPKTEEAYWQNPVIPPLHEYLQSVLERELLPVE